MPRPPSEQIAVVTGATQGMGRVTALELLKRGMRVIITGRDEARGLQVAEALKRESGNDRVELVLGDFSSLRSTHALVDAIKGKVDRVDVLVNNAGAIYKDRVVTGDGMELTFQVNHLGYFIPTLGLMPLLRAAGEARVVSVSSEVHRLILRFDVDNLQSLGFWNGYLTYSLSKLLNVLFTRELSRRLAGTNITANAAHPGPVRSGFAQQEGGLVEKGVKLIGPLLLSPESGAKTALHLALSPDVRGASGGYYVRKSLRKPSRVARDDDAAAALWERSEKLAGITW